MWHTPHTSSTTRAGPPSSETTPATTPRSPVNKPPPPARHPGGLYGGDMGILDHGHDRDMDRGRRSPGHKSSKSNSVREGDLRYSILNKTVRMERPGTVLAPQSPTICTLTHLALRFTLYKPFSSTISFKRAIIRTPSRLGNR